MQRQAPCRICYTCQVCIACEIYGEFTGRVEEPMPQVEHQPQFERPHPPVMMPRPQQPAIQPLTEERVREIVFEILTELGLVKPPQRRI